MSKPATWLLSHQKDVHSQAGEDGVIEKILEVLPSRDSWCVEFGAWDGRFLSNTRRLIEDFDYSAVMIEGSERKYHELVQNYAPNTKVIPVHAFVGFEQRNGLDTILCHHPIPRDFDFLSIDIDGNDFHTWKAFTHYRPKVVCIEFNPTIATELSFVQPADPAISQGASLLALTELGKQKGYELVSVLPWNAFFVDAQYFPLFEIEDNSPATLRQDTSCVTHLFVGFDGSIHLSGSKKLLWHNLHFKEDAFQQLPRRLRKYPGNYSTAERALFAAYLLFRSPRALAGYARRRFQKMTASRS